MEFLQSVLAGKLPQLQIDRALMISRTLETQTLGLLQATGALRLALPSKLPFDASEARHAHELGIFGSASLEQVQAAREESGGWITGMLTTLHGHGGRTISKSTLHNELLNSVLLMQPRPVVHVMVAAAMLPVNTDEIWELWFDYLELPRRFIPSTLSQLPTKDFDNVVKGFEIAPSMRSSLNELASILTDHAIVEKLLEIALEWYVQNDNPDAAMDLAMDRGLESEYLTLIKPKAAELAREEDWHKIGIMVNKLPISVITTDPDLSFWYGYDLAAQDRWSDVIDIHYRVINDWGASENAIVRGRHSLMMGSTARAEGDYEKAYQYFEQAYNTLPKSAHQERMYAAAQAGTSASQIRLGQESLPWRKRTAYELAHLPPRQRWWHSNAGPTALGYVASSGRLIAAYSQAKQQVEGLQSVDPALAWRYLLLMARIDIERMQFDSAAEAVAMARPYIVTGLQKQQTAVVESSLMAAQGDYKSAMNVLNRQPYAAGRSIHNEFVSKITTASQAFDAGDAATADLALGGAAWPADSWPRNFGDTHPSLILALLRSEHGDAQEGIEHANEVLKEAKCRRNRFLEIRSHVVLAYIYHGNGKTKDRDRELRTAMSRNSDAGYKLVFFVRGEDLRELVSDSPVVASNNNTDDLTSRELEVFRLVARSLSNKQIADKMYISVSTVKNHLSNVYEKLGTHNRRAAVRIAADSGLIPE